MQQNDVHYIKRHSFSLCHPRNVYHSLCLMLVPNISSETGKKMETSKVWRTQMRGGDATSTLALMF